MLAFFLSNSPALNTLLGWKELKAILLSVLVGLVVMWVLLYFTLVDVIRSRRSR